MRFAKTAKTFSKLNRAQPRQIGVCELSFGQNLIFCIFCLPICCLVIDLFDSQMQLQHNFIANKYLLSSPDQLPDERVNAEVTICQFVTKDS